MNYRKALKTLFLFTALVIMFFACQFQVFASDYQYKILDPKFNPSAEKIIDGTIPQVQELAPVKKHKGFDFGTFFAILAVIAFPMFIISLAVKTFKEVTEGVPGRERQTLGNVKISNSQNNVESISTPNKKITKTTRAKTVSASSIPTSNSSKPKVKSAKMSEKTSQMLKIKPESSKNNTSPIGNKNPMLLNTSPLTSNKGLCLVEYNQKYSLIGYISDEIFLLNQFENVNSKEIRSRLTETVANKDRYIVRVGNYKAIVEVSDSNMNLLLEL